MKILLSIVSLKPQLPLAVGKRVTAAITLVMLYLSTRRRIVVALREVINLSLMCSNVSVMISRRLSDYGCSVLRISVSMLAMKASSSSSE